MSKEDLEKVRQVAGREQLREIGEMRAEIEKETKSLLTGPKMRYTPGANDVIPFGGVSWGFSAGVESKYPKQVIEVYEDRQRRLANLQRTKMAFGATGPGYAGELVPVLAADFVGQVQRPMAEHQALLREKGIQQTL